jgi:acyl-CoA dehydrogenase
MYISTREDDTVGRLEHALSAVVAAEPALAKVRQAHRSDSIAGRTPEDLATQALERGIITMVEVELLRRARELARAVIMVDDFPPNFGKPNEHWEARARVATG